PASGQREKVFASSEGGGRGVKEGGEVLLVLRRQGCDDAEGTDPLPRRLLDLVHPGGGGGVEVDPARRRTLLRIHESLEQHRDYHGRESGPRPRKDWAGGRPPCHGGKVAHLQISRRGRRLPSSDQGYGRREIRRYCELPRACARWDKPRRYRVAQVFRDTGEAEGSNDHTRLARRSAGHGRGDPRGHLQLTGADREEDW